MKKIVIACDSFKGCMDASIACDVIEKAMKEIHPTYTYTKIPMADGGEGTAQILSDATNARLQTVKVKNLYHQDINVTYGIHQHTAFIEAASNLAITYLLDNQKQPLEATSYGLGQIILDAMSRDCTKIIVGLGGSGTVDGGFGMLCALGAKFYNHEGQLLPCHVSSIAKIASVDLTTTFVNLEGIEIQIASDVENTYIGKNGASYTFGPQKGLSPKQVEQMDQDLNHLATIFLQATNKEIRDVPRTGSAGGLGGAFYLLGASLVSGIDLVMDITKLELAILDADLVISGEGSIDGQTIDGKTISGIARLTSKHQVPFITFGGRVTKEASNLYDIGVTAMFSIVNECMPLETSLALGEQCLYQEVINISKILFK
ncbi:glycerate kinase [Tannockella kyphosi]|uniref:glycerate kinase n=1 Tax=Tannockella kyphosi TaxID=2899121 RepID=UPI00201378A5|nr:glycerate kinase [Tannockella kyphosi]